MEAKVLSLSLPENIQSHAGILSPGAYLLTIQIGKDKPQDTYAEVVEKERADTTELRVAFSYAGMPFLLPLKNFEWKEEPIVIWEAKRTEKIPLQAPEHFAAVFPNRILHWPSTQN